MNILKKLEKNKIGLNFLIWLSFFIVFSIAFYRLAFSAYIPNTADSIFNFYPLYSNFFSSLKAGNFPLWNMYRGLGDSFIGNLQLGLFNPVVFIVNLLFPSGYAYGVLFVCEVSLAGFFAYLYLSVIGIEKRIAYLAGFVYTLSGYFITKIHLLPVLRVMVWFPLVLFCIEYILRKKPSVFKYLLLSFAVYSFVSTGYLMLIYPSFILIFIYLIIRFFNDFKKSKKRNFVYKNYLLILTYQLLGALIFSFQILPFISSLDYKIRYINLERFSNYLGVARSFDVNVKSFFQSLVLPSERLLIEVDSFFGIAVILIIILGIFISKRKLNGYHYCFLGLSLLLVPLVLGNKAFNYVFYRIPFFKNIWSFRVLAFFTLFMVIVFAVSLQKIIRIDVYKNRSSRFFIVFLLVIFAVLLAINPNKYWLPAACIAVLASIFFIPSRLTALKFVIVFMIVSLELSMGFFNQAQNNRFGLVNVDKINSLNRKMVQEIKTAKEEYSRILSVDKDIGYILNTKSIFLLCADFSSIYSLGNIMVYDPVQYLYFKEFVGLLQEDSYHWYPKGDKYHYIIVSPFDRKLIKNLNVNVMVSNYDLRQDERCKGNLELVYSESFMLDTGQREIAEDIFLFRAETYPRFQYVDKILFSPSQEEAHHYIKSLSLGDTGIIQGMPNASFYREYDFSAGDIIGSTGIASPVNIKARSVRSTSEKDSVIEIDSKRYDQEGEGYKVVVLDKSGWVLESVRFNTVKDEDAQDDMVKFLKEVDEGNIVVIASQGNVSKNISFSLFEQLYAIGISKTQLGYDECHLVIGVKGAEAGEAVELISDEDISYEISHYRLNAIEGKRSLEVLNYTPNMIELKADVEKDSFLIIRDQYDPNWVAYIDGRETEIYRVNNTFRGIFIKEGKYFVRLKYKPDSFYWGLGISSLSIIFLLGISIVLKKKGI